MFGKRVATWPPGSCWLLLSEWHVGTCRIGLSSLSQTHSSALLFKKKKKKSANYSRVVVMFAAINPSTCAKFCDVH